MTHDDPHAARAWSHPRLAAAVGPERPWSDVDHLDEVTSTHDVALDRLRTGDEPGFVVVADRQTQGRGRAGRGWQDGPTPDASLLVTATVRAPAGELTLAPLAVGLAVVDAVDRETGLTLQLKWPNDVLADDRKCVGILVEHHTLPVGDVLLVGVGMDVDWRGADRSDDRATWTSLAEELEADVDRFALLASLLDALSARLAMVAGDPSGVVGDYRTRCVTLGREVEAAAPTGGAISGTAVDVDRHGRLLVATARERIAIAAGDVTHVRRAD